LAGTILAAAGKLHLSRFVRLINKHRSKGIYRGNKQLKSPGKSGLFSWLPLMDMFLNREIDIPFSMSELTSLAKDLKLF